MIFAGASGFLNDAFSVVQKRLHNFAIRDSRNCDIFQLEQPEAGVSLVEAGMPPSYFKKMGERRMRYG